MLVNHWESIRCREKVRKIMILKNRRGGGGASLFGRLIPGIKVKLKGETDVPLMSRQSYWFFLAPGATSRRDQEPSLALFRRHALTRRRIAAAMMFSRSKQEVPRP